MPERQGGSPSVDGDAARAAFLRKNRLQTARHHLTSFQNNIMTRTPITIRGAEKLREELRVLKSETRPKVIAAIAEAREHGDLKENAEYAAAREQQGFVEGRIAEIESKLANAQIIDVKQIGGNGKVVFGSTVTVADTDSGVEARYCIVGEDEADSRSGLISYSSPMGRALIGKSEGDVVEVNAPGGRRQLEIVTVDYL